MRTFTHAKRPMPTRALGLMVLGILVLAATGCRPPHTPTARRTDPYLEPGFPKGNNFFHQVSYQAVKAEVPKVADAEYVNDDELCATCHGAYAKAFAENVHRGDSCESCHGPASRHLEAKGKEPGLIFSFKKGDPTVRAEACLRCHEEDPCSEGARWRTSRHAHCGTTCVDCHRAHYNVPEGTPATTEPGETARAGGAPETMLASYAEPGKAEAGKYVLKDSTKGGKLPSLKGTSNHLGAVAPGTCYRCHADMQVYQETAGPHQICGPNGFNCTTCHDAHGQVRQETRRDLCLDCHDRAPTMAWHSSIHEQYGVACTDCHNPHPRTEIQQVVNISHYDVRRPRRIQMSVQDPETCYKCHPKMFGLNSLPSHHPIKEGKMVCGDCHDAHGQYEHNLRDSSVNLVCWRCHADKQGPFVYEHPPVTENCTYCHQPHGTVANNLLRQQPPFLCLRCHSGHRGSHGNGNRTGIDNKSWLIGALYTDCTQCHRHIHGSDLKEGEGAPFSR